MNAGVPTRTRTPSACAATADPSSPANDHERQARVPVHPTERRVGTAAGCTLHEADSRLLSGPVPPPYGTAISTQVTVRSAPDLTSIRL